MPDKFYEITDARQVEEQIVRLDIFSKGNLYLPFTEEKRAMSAIRAQKVQETCSENENVSPEVRVVTPTWKNIAHPALNNGEPRERVI